MCRLKTIHYHIQSPVVVRPLVATKCEIEYSVRPVDINHHPRDLQGVSTRLIWD